MIRDIKELKNHSEKFIEDFLRECTIKEKIDAYYVSVEIRTKRLIFKKSSKKVIERTDMILNSMYGRMVKDFELFRLSNEQWFSAHRGYTIYMFFLPCRKPILTEYISGTNYIIDRIEAPDGRFLNDDEIDDFCQLSQCDKFGIKKLCEINKMSELDYSNIVKDIKQGNETWIDEFVNFSSSEIFAANLPEGYIFRYGKKYIFQFLFEKEKNNEQRVGQTEKAQFEYLLIDFINYWDNIDDINSILVSNDYTKTVCQLFNKYINECEKYTHKIENNVDEMSLEAPCVGTRFDLGYEYIPDSTTKSLCAKKVLYKNIFKILLANLSRKKEHKHCILLNKDKVEKWNEIVTTLKNIC